MFHSTSDLIVGCFENNALESPTFGVGVELSLICLLFVLYHKNNNNNSSFIDERIAQKSKKKKGLEIFIMCLAS